VRTNNAFFWRGLLTLLLAVALVTLSRAETGVGEVSGPSQQPPEASVSRGRKLAHDETLRWIDEKRAWRLARKTKPIWARPVADDEVGREFQTADHITMKAGKDSWLCVGVAGEPWFQTRDKLEGKYEPDGEESRKFSFDGKPHVYRKFKPKGLVRNWVAQVSGPGIEGFYVRPGYDPEVPLYSPAGGYVVKDDVANPYKDSPKDVWLVQKALFESTYELIPNPVAKAGDKREPIPQPTPARP
jgi:hypothetical protein